MKYIGLFLLCMSNALATSDDSITKTRLQAHVAFLGSDALEGRLTGSVGERQATHYIAHQFLQLGLEPAGDKGTFFQAFYFTAGLLLGKNNTLSMTNSDGKSTSFRLGKEWLPLSFSKTGSFANGELVFAGYGIKAQALNALPTYNSYAGLHVKNKWVLVFKDMPEGISVERQAQLRQYASLRYKAFTAKEQGAKGIIFVSNPDSKVRDELIPFSSTDSRGSNAGIVVLSVKHSLINNMPRDIKIVGQIDIKKDIQQGRNVLAKLKIHANATSTIVVGAHVDHLGRGTLGGSRRRSDETGMVHNGADDNASGVASILEVARLLNELKAHGALYGEKDILFAAWSGEELGLLGSTHFVNNLVSTSKKSLVDVAINLDMVGHLREKLVLQGVGSSSDWPEMLEGIKKRHPLALMLQKDPYLPTDSTSFYTHKVPVLNFFTGAHDHYHTPRDKADTLNYAGMKLIAEFLVDLIVTLEHKAGLVAYQECRKPQDHNKNKLKLYLGTIPDYTHSDDLGVRLSGIAKESPAEQAGVQQDDVVIQLAGKKIHDLYDYSFVLNTLHVGERVPLVVLRGKDKIKLTISARYRD